MNILDTIIAKKKIEVAERKSDKSIAELENGPFFKNKTLSFRDFLLRKIKRASLQNSKENRLQKEL